MTTKNVTVVVPDKLIGYDNEFYTVDPWPFSDSSTWAIQWDGKTETGDVELNPAGDNTALAKSDYETKVKPYVDEWTKAKAAADKAAADAAKDTSDLTAQMHKVRTDAEAAGKLPRFPLDTYFTEKDKDDTRDG
tara:strand:+ start:16805 stop:17206 length:402 start_codon:yes stop_codon:yes gene_type:complete